MAEDKNLVVIDNREIQNMIYTFRGKQVMVDSDLAELSKVTTGNLNKAMKRNSSRFPEHFCFQLTEPEYENLRFQNGTSSSNNNYGGRRYMPYVFTEQGIAMQTICKLVHLQNRSADADFSQHGKCADRRPSKSDTA